jgi:Protein of unknown function (DUF3667)
VSHLKERAEKICLNCRTLLAGRFCHICGQENIEPKETVWHLVTHFFNDITHFDGKFFSTLGLLIRKPGFLPGEYMLGRRASYLNPIRMYIFTSAIFFLIFFSTFHITDKSINETMKMDIGGKTLNELRSLNPDSLRIFTAKHNKGKPIPPEGLEKYLDSIKNNMGLDLTDEGYTSKRQYDSVLKNGIIKHNWLHRKFVFREIEINDKYNHNVGGYVSSLLSTFVHSFPQMLFISLPLFALILKLLYRRRKDYYYVSHGIFGIHFYIFVFIVMLLMLGLDGLSDLLHWEWLKFLGQLPGLIIFFYLYKAMRNFYRQRRAKTIGKFLLLNILSAFMIAFLFIVFILFSFMKI